MAKVILGGTFDILHKGHKALLKRAVKLGKVTIGLTSDEFALKLKKREITPFNERKKVLQSFFKKNLKENVRIIKIGDIFGPTLKENFDFLVVSEETYKNALKINQAREKIHKPPIKVIKVKLVLAEDGKPISASRIRNGEIDREGRLCRFCKIVLGKKEALKIFEDEKFLAFLDKNPRNPGHTLLIPKKHFRWVWDIPYIGQYFKVAQKIAKALRKFFKTQWIIAPVLGDDVWHAHLHLIPRMKNDNFVYLPPKIKKITPKKMKEIQKGLKKLL